VGRKESVMNADRMMMVSILSACIIRRLTEIAAGSESKLLDHGHVNLASTGHKTLIYHDYHKM
jgi:hypothetical protein